MNTDSADVLRCHGVWRLLEADRLAEVEAQLAPVQHHLLSFEADGLARFSYSHNLNINMSSGAKAEFYAVTASARVSLQQGDAAAAISALSENVLVDRTKLDLLLAANSPLGMFGRVVYLMTITTLGHAFLATHDTANAQKCFDLAVETLDRKLYTSPTLTTISNPEFRKVAQTEGLDQWLVWSEEALYAAVGISAIQKNHEKVILLARRYTLLLSQSPVSFCTTRRATILRVLLSTIAIMNPLPNELSPVESLGATILNPFGISSPFSGLSDSSVLRVPNVSLVVAAEFQGFLPLYEALVVETCRFPRPGVSVDSIEGVRERRVVEMFEWVATLELLPAGSVAGVGGGNNSVWEAVEKGYKIVEIMYRATKHTFENLLIHRYLAHAFVSLLAHLCDSASDAELAEGLLSVKAYVSLYQRRRGEIVVARGKEGIAFDGIVEGETNADVVGVLVAGVRLCLAWFRSDDELLDTAKRYIDIALNLLNESNPSELVDGLLRAVLQWKGVIYGELAVEVADSVDRVAFQRVALDSLRESVENEKGVVTKDWRAFYQIALQCGEVGEVADAVTAIQESLHLNSTNVASWNLLALLLTSLHQYSEAVEVCEAGWKEVLDSVTAKIAHPEASMDRSDVWDSVPVRVKEDLFNLKLTQLEITTKLAGSKVGLEALQPLFSLFSHMFGQLLKALDPATQTSISLPSVAYSYASSEASVSRQESPVFNRHDRMPSSSSGNFQHRPTSGVELPHSRMGTDITVSPTAASVRPPFFGYSFRTYDLQICLWTTAARLYTQMGLFLDAALALAEAETLAKGWISLDAKVRGRESLLFKVGAELGERMEKEEGGIVPLPAKKVTLLKRGTSKSGSGIGKSGIVEKGQESSGVDVAKRWGVADSSLRRVLADICFGNILLKEAKYLAAQESIKLPSFGKYLPASVETMVAEKSSLVRRNSFQSTFTVNHSTQSIRPNSVKSSLGSLAGNNLSASSEIAGGQPGRSSSRASSIASPPKTMGVPEEPTITLDAIIDDLNVCLALDEDHVPSRVELAKMYQLKSLETLSEAEYWFERACKRSKLRGSGSGSRGLSTHFGGLTSSYGVDSWAGLGEVMRETASLLFDEGKPVVSEIVIDVARLEAAKECLYFAVQSERTATVRGYQCLSRTCD